MGVPAMVAKMDKRVLYLMIGLGVVCIMPSAKIPVDAQAVVSDPNPRNALWHGSGPPVVPQGEDGDFYIDTTPPKAVYGPRSMSTWPGPFSMVGDAGSNGTNGTNGSAATIAVGTVSPLSAGASPTVVNAGTSSAASFNFGIPAGAQGVAGTAGVNSFGAPTARTVAFATAYQATNTAKPAVIGIEVTCSTTIALGSATANTVELIIGPTNAVAGGAGTKVDTLGTDLSVSILLSLGWTSRQFLQANLPAGYYFAARRVTGTACVIGTAFDQSVG